MKFLHVMLRVRDIEPNLAFFAALGFKQSRYKEYPKGRFTLVYLQADDHPIEIELTHNWDAAEDYSIGNNFGHLAFEVDDINAKCDELATLGGKIVRPPRDGHMAFVKTPDGISIELLQRGEAITPSEKYLSMANIGTW